MKNILICLLIVVCAVSLSSCKKKVCGCTDSSAANYNSEANDDDGSCVYLSIGQSYEGGVIAYVLKSGDPGYEVNTPHGIIAATTDQSNSLRWYNGTYVTTSATGTAIGTGSSNTSSIVSAQGAGSYAAKLCSDLTLNGYSDWYLPSKDELNKLYLNKTAIGNFMTGAYWSSSESGSNTAYSQYFSNGNQLSEFKSYTYNIRAVRAF